MNKDIYIFQTQCIYSHSFVSTLICDYFTFSILCHMVWSMHIAACSFLTKFWIFRHSSCLCLPSRKHEDRTVPLRCIKRLRNVPLEPSGVQRVSGQEQLPDLLSFYSVSKAFFLTDEDTIKRPLAKSLQDVTWSYRQEVQGTLCGTWGLILSDKKASSIIRSSSVPNTSWSFKVSDSGKPLIAHILKPTVGTAQKLSDWRVVTSF